MTQPNNKTDIPIICSQRTNTESLDETFRHPLFQYRKTSQRDDLKSFDETFINPIENLLQSLFRKDCKKDKNSKL